MIDARASEIWQRITSLLEDKLQYGIIEQAKSVVRISLIGNGLKLYVSSDEAAEFFSSDVNQQRLSILARPILNIETIEVERVDAEPLK